MAQLRVKGQAYETHGNRKTIYTKSISGCQSTAMTGEELLADNQESVPPGMEQ